MTSRSARVSPRKLPSQERSRETVEAILAAAARILIADGYEGASTSRIAVEAGVSPGSLYQYFPNRDSIVIAVVDRMFERTTARFSSQFMPRLDEPVAVLVPAVLRAMVEALDHERGLLRAVVENIPARDGLEKLADFERRATEVSHAYFSLHRDEIRAVEPEVATWMLIRAIEQLLIRYALDSPPIPRERFLEETTRLALNYVASGSTESAGG